MRIGDDGRDAGQPDLLDEVGAGQERRIDAGAEVRRRHEDDVPVVARDRVHPGEDRVRRAMDVDRVRLQRRAGSVHGQRFDFVDEHDDRAAAQGEVGDGPLEEARHGALALTQELARERMGIDVDEEDRPVVEDARGLVGQPARERGLAGPGGPASTMRPWIARPTLLDAAALASGRTAGS